MKKLLDRYIVEKQIGSGANGNVYRCRLISDETLSVAVKQISLKKNKAKDSEFLREIKNEIDILKTLDSPFIVRYIDFHATPENVYIVTEYLAGQELLDEVLKDGYLAEHLVRKYFKMVLLGVNHAHSAGIIHRDIKAENIIFKDTNKEECKLIDFGLGVKGLNFATGIVGTPFYMAPELFTNKFYDKKYDVWSLGVLFYVMLCGYPPYPGNDHKEIFRNIRTKELTFAHAEFKNVSVEAKKLINRLLEKDPNNRITINKALEHDFFINNETPINQQMTRNNDLLKNLNNYKRASALNKATRICMSKLYDGKNLDKLKKLFLEADSNHNGMLDKNEFWEVMKKLGYKDHEISKMLESLDISGDGQIEYSEFVAACISFQNCNVYVAATMIFNMIDKDNSKTIEYKEFRDFFRSQKMDLDDAEIKRMFEEIDEDGSKTIEFNEFVQKFKNMFE